MDSAADNESQESTSCCANCGQKETDKAKLKACTACKLVKYCNKDCQISHHPRHKEACKKRAAELRSHEEALFRQPPKKEDCPICFLMLPEGKRGCGQAYSCCCGKIICCGCWYAHESCNMDNTCPFCRAPRPDTVEQFLEKLNRRIEVNDAEAYFRLGTGYMKGNKEMKVAQDREKGLKFWLRAGELGSAKAYRQLGCVYMNGDGGVEKDEKKGRHFHELAAIGGNARSRHILGVIEHQAGNMEKSIKHHMIAARLGYTGSLNQIKQSFLTGVGATRDDYLQSLRSYQQYVDEVRSAQRDVAAASHETYKYLEE